eukprot:Opistho-1_new@90157
MGRRDGAAVVGAGLHRGRRLKRKVRQAAWHHAAEELWLVHERREIRDAQVGPAHDDDARVDGHLRFVDHLLAEKAEGEGRVRGGLRWHVSHALGVANLPAGTHLDHFVNQRRHRLGLRRPPDAGRRARVHAVVDARLAQLPERLPHEVARAEKEDGVDDKVVERRVLVGAVASEHDKVLDIVHATELRRLLGRHAAQHKHTDDLFSARHDERVHAGAVGVLLRVETDFDVVDDGRAVLHCLDHPRERGKVARVGAAHADAAQQRMPVTEEELLGDRNARLGKHANEPPQQWELGHSGRHGHHAAVVVGERRKRRVKKVHRPALVALVNAE